MGTDSTTQSSTYYVGFTKTGTGSAIFTDLPWLKVKVDATVATVNVPSAVSCTLTADSIPVVATYSAAPYKDVTVKVTAKTYNATKGEKDPSSGITPGTTTVTLTTSVSSGVLGFSCGAALSTLTTP